MPTGKQNLIKKLKLKIMFEYVKIKIIQQAENPHWLFNGFIGTEKLLNGRIVRFRNGEIGNHQVQHPKYVNWFDIPKNLVEVIKNTVDN